jgi:hypothetical protein
VEKEKQKMSLSQRIFRRPIGCKPEPPVGCVANDSCREA